MMPDPIFKAMIGGIASFGLLVCPCLSADTLTVGSANAPANTTVFLPFTFSNTHQIVGLQFDLVYPQSFVEAGLAQAASSSTNHQADSRVIGPGVQRIVLSSSSNQLLPDDIVLQIPLTLGAVSPQGGPSVKIQNIILSDAQGQSFSPVLNFSALETWKKAHFSDAELEDPNVAGDDRDGDGDQISNLMEFLTGRNPRIREQGGILNLMPMDVGTANAGLRVRFRSRKDLGGAGLNLESSTDLKIWTSSGIQLVPTGVEDATSLELEALLPWGTESRRFLRLLGERPAGQ